jgi:hypothetical protein
MATTGLSAVLAARRWRRIIIRELAMNITPWLEFVIVHRRWAAPLIWLGGVTLFTAGALSAGFEGSTLPWIAGVVAVLVAGFLAGVFDVWRGRAVGWLGIAGWLVIPVLHLLAEGTADSWTVPFVADLVAILGAEAGAAAAIAGSFLPPRPGSRWEGVTGDRAQAVGASKAASVTNVVPTHQQG